MPAAFAYHPFDGGVLAVAWHWNCRFLVAAGITLATACTGGGKNPSGFDLCELSELSDSSAPSDLSELSEMSASSDSPAPSDLSELSEMSASSDSSAPSDLSDLSELSEMSASSDSPAPSDLSDLSELSEMSASSDSSAPSDLSELSEMSASSDSSAPSDLSELSEMSASSDSSAPFDLSELSDLCAVGLGICIGASFIYCPPGSPALLSVECDDLLWSTKDTCIPGFGCKFEPLVCESPDVCSAAMLDPVSGECSLDPVDCGDDDPCTVDGCSAESGCTHEQADCEDGDPCTMDTCSPEQGGCAHFPYSCEDDNPCTLDLCLGDGDCSILPADLPCNDNNPCTLNDKCSQGMCAGMQMPCGEGYTCAGGKCVCADPCGTKKCGFDGCQQTCGVCSQWQECVEGTCLDFYPPAPYGPWVGMTMPNHLFIDPVDLSPVNMAEYWNDGRVLLMTFNAGWCIVCKEDTSLLNMWHKLWHDDGLRIVSILYELPSQAPITQDYALWWKDYYPAGEAVKIQFDLFMDTPTADSKGAATGGVLSYYTGPGGPVKDGTFPVTLLICPKNMKILYVAGGFYDEIITPQVEKYLFTQDCDK
jgi:ferritin-like protein